MTLNAVLALWCSPEKHPSRLTNGERRGGSTRLFGVSRSVDITRRSLNSPGKLNDCAQATGDGFGGPTACISHFLPSLLPTSPILCPEHHITTKFQVPPALAADADFLILSRKPAALTSGLSHNHSFSYKVPIGPCLYSLHPAVHHLPASCHSWAKDSSPCTAPPDRPCIHLVRLSGVKLR